MARLSDSQLADRRNHLGASDIAVLAGVSPYQSAFELYLEKIGELDPDARRSDDDRARMERGHRLEDVALDWHADIAGIQIERIRRDVRHPRLPYIVVHPDARVRPWSKTRRLIEAKTGRTPDGLRRDWEAQVQAQMAATGAVAVDIVVLGFDGPPAVITVERDEELIAALEGLAASFWDRVQRRDPPPVDGSHGASKWLDRMHWRDEPEQVATPEQAQALARLLWVRAETKRLEAEDAAIVNALKLTMAGGSRLYARGVGKVLWTAPTTRRTVAWKEVAGVYRRLIETLKGAQQITPAVEAAMSAEVGTTSLDDIEGLYATVDDSARTFRVTPPKESEA